MVITGNLRSFKSSTDVSQISSVLRFQEFPSIVAKLEVLVELVSVADQSFESLASEHHLFLGFVIQLFDNHNQSVVIKIQ
jgi:hypothetical protein